MTSSATDRATPDSPLAPVIAYGQGRAKAPDAAQTVQALLALEKAARRDRPPLGFAVLQGDWRLVFITGTKRSRKTAGKVLGGKTLGAGRFLPRWIEIAIAYHAAPAAPLDSQQNLAPESEPNAELGTVKNRVRFGGVDLMVSGPTRLYGSRRILAFDFLRIRFALAGITLFDGYVRGGQGREQAFGQKSLKDQAFFTYFWVEEQLIAARGRGGGLAIWVRVGSPARDSVGSAKPAVLPADA